MGSSENGTDPPVDEEPEPGTTSDDPLADQLVEIDAPQALRQEFFGPTVGASVARPGRSEVAGTGGRTAVHGAHNWVPTGPRNVGGRVRAIAIDPARREIMYAAPASGGVFKSLDGAESWFPLWHDEPSLSMSALAICADDPAVVWAGTGEPVSGGGETIPGAGVWRSTNGGETWTPPGAGAISDPERRVHALAAHPHDKDHCWAATDDGLFRTINGGGEWTQFAGGLRTFTDVVFAEIGGRMLLFAALRGTVTDPGPPIRRRQLVIRVDRPDLASPALANILVPDPFDPAHVDPIAVLSGAFPALPSDGDDPGHAKLAIYAGGAPGFADPVLYVVYATAKKKFFGLFRCRNPGAQAPGDLTWTPLPNPAIFRGEKQGNYNLALAVSPRNPNHLAFGMVELFLDEQANGQGPKAADWKRAQMWDLYHVERGHHADHHQLVFAPPPAAPFDGRVPADRLVLWDANDGGISACFDWQGSTTYPIADEDVPEKLATAVLPVPDRAPTWRKRSHGISATQMYDLNQHPRLDTVMGCGFQDNGAYLATGGPSWQLLLAADGGFVAFDPDDAYRMLVTWQNGIAEAFFPGRLRRALPLLGEGVHDGLWPRVLTDGFLRRDQSPFVAETAFHPTQPGRVLTARRNRLYGTRRTTGERWIASAVGPGIEIVHRPTVARVASSSLEVRDTPGALALGLLPQRTVTELEEDRQMASRVRSLASQPFTIPNGETLALKFGGDGADAAEVEVRVPLAVGPSLPAQATAAQLAAYLEHEIRDRLPAVKRPQVDVLPVIWPRSSVVVVASKGTGKARKIHFDSSDPFMFGIAAARDFVGADRGAGGEALPAIVPLDFGMGAAGVDVSGATLHFEREGAAAVVDIDCNREFPAPARAYTADLAAVLRRRLPPDQYLVWTGPVAHGIRLAMTASAPATQRLTMSGSFAGGLDLEPGPSGRTVRVANSTSFDLRDRSNPALSRRLKVSEAAGRATAERALDPAFLGVADVMRVTAVELCGAIRKLIDAPHDVRVRCDLDLHPVHVVDDSDRSLWETSSEGYVTELAFGPVDSRRLWAGDGAGRLYRSQDDGETWTEVESPFTDRFGEIEAIAVRPDAPDHVLIGAYVEEPQPDPTAMLYGTTTGGPPWTALTPIVDGAGMRVGIHALLIDPHAPDHVYAATDIGVFHSANGGGAWDAFNQGLPNARVIDFAYAETTRMLRAGVWGRGVHERHIGELPARDVRLHIRSTALDDGTAQPSPGPDLLAASATPLALDASPDVKHLRSDPRLGVLLDGVEFDEDVVSTDVRAGPAVVAVQVHNRGAFTTSTARTAVLWAAADAGPPPLDDLLHTALDAGPLASGARFGAWTVLGDTVFSDPFNAGHALVAPGYPRVALLGSSPAFSWSEDDLRGHRRIGLLALCRCDEDPLRVEAREVLELVRAEPKAAYRECAVVAAGVDARTVVRVERGAGFRVQAPAAGGGANGANGAAPFGLAATAGPVLEARFGRAEPYDLSGGVVGFRLTLVHDQVVVPLRADDPTFRNIARADAVDVAAVVNRALVAAGVPVRASNRAYQGGSNDAVRIAALRDARFSVAGTAGLLGLNTAATTRCVTPIGNRGPWDLTPPNAGPRELRIQATTTVDVRLGPGTPEIRNPAAAAAAEVRAAINRQIAQAGLETIVADPLEVALSVRRSVTEAVGSRVVSGGFAIADLAGSPDPIPEAGREARFRVLAAHDLDRLAPSHGNLIYVKVSNAGTVRLDAARVRLYELVVTATPVTGGGAPFGTVTAALAPEASAILEVPFGLDARPSGSRVFVLAIADTADTPLDPPTTFPSLDEAHGFCRDNAGAAIRELVVA